MILVSACLCGMKCRWDGSAKPIPKAIELVRQGKAIPVCPEQLAGLPTPRAPAEQKGSSVITKDGNDVTVVYQKGADETLGIAKLFNCSQAVFKSNSPTCGCGKVYDGTFSGKLIGGDGIATKLLKENGIEVRNEFAL